MKLSCVMPGVNAKELDAGYKKVSTILAEHSASVLLSMPMSKTCISEGTLPCSLMYDGVSVSRREHYILI